MVKIYNALTAILAFSSIALAAGRSRIDGGYTWPPTNKTTAGVSTTRPKQKTKEIQGAANNECPVINKRGTTSFNYAKWPNATIPYVLEGLPSHLGDRIRDAMREWETGTCARFRQRVDGDQQWVKFTKIDDGCFSEMRGAPGEGEMIVNFDLPNWYEKTVSYGFYKGCAADGVAPRVLGEVLGLENEHQRPDRDDYVRVEWNRVAETDKPYFDINPCASTDTPFDYNSVMMFDRKTLSNDCTYWAKFAGKEACKNTLTSLTDEEISPNEHPTLGDRTAVNIAYNCPADTRRPLPSRRDSPEAPADRWEISTYEFVIDSFTYNYARDNNLHWIGVHQHCDGDGLGHDSNNWAFVRLDANGFGSEHKYSAEVDRCRKRHNRTPSRYEIALCSNDKEDACPQLCGYRGIRPIDPQKRVETSPKAVSVSDDVMWVCHKH